MNPIDATSKSLPNNEDGKSLSEPRRTRKRRVTIQWTASHMLTTSGTMENLVRFYTRIPNQFEEVERRIKRRLRMEEAPVQEATFLRRLRAKRYRRQQLATTSDDHPAVSNPNSECCSICLGDYEDEEIVALLYYCRHFFHWDCLRKWLLKKNSCPICRNLAFIPEMYPDWEGDIEDHQKFFLPSFLHSQVDKAIIPTHRTLLTAAPFKDDLVSLYKCTGNYWEELFGFTYVCGCFVRVKYTRDH